MKLPLTYKGHLIEVTGREVGKYRIVASGPALRRRIHYNPPLQVIYIFGDGLAYDHDVAHVQNLIDNRIKKAKQ